MKDPLTIKLAQVMLDLHDKDSKTFLEILVTGSVHRSIMISIYRLLTNEGALKHLEDLETDAKKKLWDRCHKMIAGRLEKEKCIEFTKAIYTLDLISQQ